MTKTHTTAEAATIAQVTPRTIRRWATTGRVVATKTNHGWAINTDSLTEAITARTSRNAARIAKHADLTPYKDKTRAHAKVVQLLEDGALVAGTRPGIYTAISSDGTDKYLVDTHAAHCDCKAHQRLQYCTHLTTAQASDASKGATRPMLALVAA